LYATTPDEKPAEVEIVDDTAEFNARRITCIHSKTPPKNGRAVIAVYSMVAEDLNESGFQDFIKKFNNVRTAIKRNGSIVEISAQSDTAKLKLKADIEKERRIEIEGDDPAARSAILMVNSKELGLPIIERAISLNYE